MTKFTHLAAKFFHGSRNFRRSTHTRATFGTRATFRPAFFGTTFRRSTFTRSTFGRTKPSFGATFTRTTTFGATFAGATFFHVAADFLLDAFGLFLKAAGFVLQTGFFQRGGRSTQSFNATHHFHRRTKRAFAIGSKGRTISFARRTRRHRRSRTVAIARSFRTGAFSITGSRRTRTLAIARTFGTWTFAVSRPFAFHITVTRSGRTRTLAVSCTFRSGTLAVSRAFAFYVAVSWAFAAWAFAIARAFRAAGFAGLGLNGAIGGVQQTLGFVH